MAFIGFILCITFISLYIGLLGVVISSTAMTIWWKITLISLMTFVYAGLVAAVKTSHIGDDNSDDE